MVARTSLRAIQKSALFAHLEALSKKFPTLKDWQKLRSAYVNLNVEGNTSAKSIQKR